MKIKTEKKTFASFQAAEIKVSQQKGVKGGEGTVASIIGIQDIVAG